MKYIDAEKLKRFVGELKERAKRNRCDSWGIVPDALEEVEGFIESLQQEQQEVDLEKELKDERTKLLDAFGPMNGEQCLAIRNFARHFYELGLNARKED